MLSSLRFGSFLIYAPRGRTQAAARAKRFVKLHLKQDLYQQGSHHTASEFVALRMKEELPPPTALGSILTPEAVLVPVPRSAPLTRGALWPALRIAEALVRQGFGSRVEGILERTDPVARSAAGFSASDRPTPELHHQTMAVKNLKAGPADEVVVVDDVVTRGSTLLGAASLLMEAIPCRRIAGFAVVRTMSELEDVPSMIAPCLGTITYRGGRLVREP